MANAHLEVVAALVQLEGDVVARERVDGDLVDVLQLGAVVPPPVGHALVERVPA